MFSFFNRVGVNSLVKKNQTRPDKKRGEAVPPPPPPPPLKAFRCSPRSAPYGREHGGTLFAAGVNKRGRQAGEQGNPLCDVTSRSLSARLGSARRIRACPASLEKKKKRENKKQTFSNLTAAHHQCFTSGQIEKDT